MRTSHLPDLIARLHLLGLAVLLALGSLDRADAAGAEQGVSLPRGEAPIALAWDSAESVVLLAESSNGYALYRAQLGSASLEKLTLPRGLAVLSPGKHGPDPDFCLAANGSALAILRPASAALKERELLLYTIRGAEVKEISERLPPGFWPALMAFKPDGSELFLAARSFVNPDQPYSIGSFSLESGKFYGVTLKANVDLVDALAYVPQRRVLAIRAGGINGAYPLQPVLLGLDLGALELHLLHSEAAQLQPRPLADGRLLLRYDASLKSPGGGNLGREARMDWILPAQGWELEAANLTLEEAAQSIDIAPDGSWLAFLALPRALGLNSAAPTTVLTLQRFSDSRTVLTETPCSSFAFSADSRYVCALDAAGGRILFYELPQD